jgi:hypothetical protein
LRLHKARLRSCSTRRVTMLLRREWEKDFEGHDQLHRSPSLPESIAANGTTRYDFWTMSEEWKGEKFSDNLVGMDALIQEGGSCGGGGSGVAKKISSSRGNLEAQRQESFR